MPPPPHVVCSALAVAAEPIPPRQQSMLAGVIRILPGPAVAVDAVVVVPDTPPPLAAQVTHPPSCYCLLICTRRSTRGLTFTTTCLAQLTPSHIAGYYYVPICHLLICHVVPVDSPFLTLDSSSLTLHPCHLVSLFIYFRLRVGKTPPQPTPSSDDSSPTSSASLPLPEDHLRLARRPSHPLHPPPEWPPPPMRC